MQNTGTWWFLPLEIQKLVRKKVKELGDRVAAAYDLMEYAKNGLEFEVKVNNVLAEYYKDTPVEFNADDFTRMYNGRADGDNGFYVPKDEKNQKSKYARVDTSRFKLDLLCYWLKHKSWKQTLNDLSIDEEKIYRETSKERGIRLAKQKVENIEPKQAEIPGKAPDTIENQKIMDEANNLADEFMFYLVEGDKISGLKATTKLWQLFEQHDVLDPLRIFLSQFASNVRDSDNASLTMPFESALSRLYSKPGWNFNEDYFKATFEHWYHLHCKIVFRHFHRKKGLNLMVFPTDLSTIEQKIKPLDWLFDLFLINANVPQEALLFYQIFLCPSAYDEEYEPAVTYSVDNWNIDIPKISHSARRVFDRVHSKDPSKCFIHFDIIEDKICSHWISGIYRKYPEFVYEFFMKRTYNEVMRSNKFVIVTDYLIESDKYYSCIVASWNWKYIPLFVSESIASQKVDIIHSVSIALPSFKPFDNSKVSQAQKHINTLFSATRENAIYVLNNLKFDLEILLNSHTAKTKLTISLVEFSILNKRITYPVLSL